MKTRKMMQRRKMMLTKRMIMIRRMARAARDASKKILCGTSDRTRPFSTARILHLACLMRGKRLRALVAFHL
jgi:hypothetical protein